MNIYRQKVYLLKGDLKVVIQSSQVLISCFPMTVPKSDLDCSESCTRIQTAFIIFFLRNSKSENVKKSSFATILLHLKYIIVTVTNFHGRK